MKPGEELILELIQTSSKSPKGQYAQDINEQQEGLDLLSNIYKWHLFFLISVHRTEMDCQYQDAGIRFVHYHKFFNCDVLFHSSALNFPSFSLTVMTNQKLGSLYISIYIFETNNFYTPPLYLVCSI